MEEWRSMALIYRLRRNIGDVVKQKGPTDVSIVAFFLSHLIAIEHSKTPLKLNWIIHAKYSPHNKQTRYRKKPKQKQNKNWTIFRLTK